MMHVVARIPRGQVGQGRKMYSPAQRGLVVNSIGYNYDGLGELEGMFNIGKMFTRMFTFTPSSFKFKNIAGAIGSAVTTVGTGGLANVASEVAGPSGLKLTKGTITGAHSKPMQYVGYGTMAAAAAVGLYFGGGAALTALKGVGGVAATGTGLSTVGTASSGSSVIGAATGQIARTGGGLLSTIGSGLSTIGSGLMTGLKAIGTILPAAGKVMGGGGGGEQYGPSQSQAEAYTQQQAYEQQAYTQQQAALAEQNRQQQAVYDEYVRQQQTQMYVPQGTVQPVSTNASYGDLRSPYTAITEDGQQVQVDPNTGQVIQPSMFAGISTEMMIGIGAIALVGGIYFMSGNEKMN